MKIDKLPGSQIREGQEFLLHINRTGDDRTPIEPVVVRVKSISGKSAEVEGLTFRGRFDVNVLGMLGTKK